jgi:hypothetical protein
MGKLDKKGILDRNFPHGDDLVHILFKVFLEEGGEPDQWYHIDEFLDAMEEKLSEFINKNILKKIASQNITVSGSLLGEMIMTPISAKLELSEYETHVRFVTVHSPRDT